MDVPSWLPGVVVAIIGAIVTIAIAIWRAGVGVTKVVTRVDSLDRTISAKADGTETALRIAGISERANHLATAERVAALEHRIDRVERQIDERAGKAR